MCVSAGSCEGLGLAAIDFENILPAVVAALQPFARPEQSIDSSTVIMGDLEIDSVAVLDVVMELEEKFDISVPMELMPKITTIGDLASHICAIRAGDE